MNVIQRLDKSIEYLEEQKFKVKIQSLRKWKFKDDPYPVNGAIWLANKRILLLFKDGENIREIAPMLSSCLIHEFGHRLHFEELGGNYRAYDKVDRMEREYMAWELGWEHFPQKYRPAKSLYQKIMDSALDTYLKANQ